MTGQSRPLDGRVYSAFGLSIVSQLALPDLPELPELPGTVADVVIVTGHIAALADERPGYTLTQDGALLSITDVGRFLIEGGRRIVVEAAPGASARNVRLFLLGSAIGALLHQRGLLPLHANAIGADGRAVAFMGASGAGKSTLAAWFLDRGYQLLTDDVCAVAFDPDGVPMAQPGLARLRLWEDALAASGRAAGDFERSFDDREKFDVPAGAAPRPLRLDRIYLLGRGDGIAAIRPLRGVEAVAAITSNTYRGGYVGLAGTADRHLQSCLQLVRSAQVFAVDRLWGFDQFDAQAGRLEQHAFATAR